MRRGWACGRRRGDVFAERAVVGLDEGHVVGSVEP